jgi:hypothetical protein
MKKIIKAVKDWIDRYRLGMNPFLITTTDGLRDRRELDEVRGGLNDDNEATSWVEYYDKGRLVHRSAHVRLKKAPEFIQSTVGGLR